MANKEEKLRGGGLLPSALSAAVAEAGSHSGKLQRQVAKSLCFRQV